MAQTNVVCLHWYAHACCVVARQYSAVLRMLQIRQSSSMVNFAASEPSFSFRRLLMVSPPVLLLDLKKGKHQKKKQKGVNKRMLTSVSAKKM